MNIFCRWTVALLLMTALSACVSIDSRVLKEVPAAGATGDIRAAYWNNAFYRSRGELLGHAGHDGVDVLQRAADLNADDIG